MPKAGNNRLADFTRSQSVNAYRNAKALRPFSDTEFGTGAASPSTAHIRAANGLVSHLRKKLMQSVQSIQHEVGETAPLQIEPLLLHKQQAVNNAKKVEAIWDFYLELFGQRQTRFADMLLGLDRIALDCYQCIYTGLGTAQSIPSPPPLSYMETGFTPSTFRRGIKMSKLGRNINPFPIVQLPYHRMVNPWTLGAVHHEVAHNIQSDLGMWQTVPKRIVQRLQAAGLPPELADIWGRWHKEIWADLCGLLLGGPEIVTSLLDVLARTPKSTLSFNPTGVHPTPYLRALINFELLRRMGFRQEASELTRLWRQIYPNIQRGHIPKAMLGTFPKANQLVVDTICYQPYQQLGKKSLAQIFSFNRTHKQMTDEAAKRLAQGIDPGIVPARFLVGATRTALNQRLASPEQIAQNFYKALAKR